MAETDERVRELQRAIDQTGRIVAEVKPEQHQLPTPCARWPVADLVDHIVSGVAVFTRMAQGEPRSEMRGHLSDEDWSEQYRARAKDLLGVWSDEETFKRPRKGAPPEVLLELTTMDLVIHSWDLATATSSQIQLDDGLAESALQFALGFVRPEGRAPSREDVGDTAPLGPPVPVPDDAPPYARLAAFLGRPG